MKFILILLVIIPIASLSESIAPYPNSARLRDVISTVGPSWGGAGSYKAMLIREHEAAALLIFSDPFDLHPILYAPGIAFVGETWGAIPWLEFDARGNLLIQSENYTYGRNKWSKSLTIAEQNSQFIVSEYSFSSYDTQNPDNQTDCRIDFGAGLIYVNGEATASSVLPKQVLVTEWIENYEHDCN